MKKILFILFAALAFVACDKDFQSQTEKTDLEAVVQNNKVSLKQALLYAENSVNGINPTTRSAERKVKSTEIYVAKPATRSAEDTEVSFYLINYEDNEGFAMVSTDSRTTPVYAYSDSGNLTPEDLETNPGFQLYMEEAIANYEYDISIYDNTQPLPIIIPDSLDGHVVLVDGVECYSKKDYYSSSILGPYLTVTWHQGDPYNYYCGVGNATGCGPTAMAQIMSLYKYPSSHNGYTYAWSSMVANAGFNMYDRSEGALSTAKLMYDVGIASGVTEHGPSTGTNPADHVDAFEVFGYNCSDLVSYNTNIIIDEIDDGRPVFICGYNSSGGHGWVIDGYDRKYSITKYYRITPPYPYYKSISNPNDVMYYFHCNMGWGNGNNAFLLETNFGFVNNKHIIYQIYPN